MIFGDLEIFLQQVHFKKTAMEFPPFACRNATFCHENNHFSES